MLFFWNQGHTQSAISIMLYWSNFLVILFFFEINIVWLVSAKKLQLDFEEKKHFFCQFWSSKEKRFKTCTFLTKKKNPEICCCRSQLIVNNTGQLDHIRTVSKMSNKKINWRVLFVVVEVTTQLHLNDCYIQIQWY